MEQYVASIKKFFLGKWPVKIYSTKIPAEIETPSIYYHLPDLTDDSFNTKESYQTFQILRAPIFEATDDMAFYRAHSLAEEIRKASYKVPLVASDGSIISDQYVEIEKVNCRLIHNQEAQLAITFTVTSKLN